MTDPRIDGVLLASAQGLPRGGGIVLRHEGRGDRYRLFMALRRIARRRGLMLFVKGDPRLARRWQADGAHLGTPPRRLRKVAPRNLALSASVHDRRELLAARQIGCAVVHVSPVYPTRSHPGQRPIGAHGLRRIAAKTAIPVVALGGMTAARARPVGRIAHGWAAIDGLAVRRTAR